MKKTIAIVLLIFGAMSCSLKEKITSYTEGDKYYRSVEQIKTGLNACYSPLKLIYTNMGFWEMCECATDLMYLNIDNQIDAVCDIAPARPGAASLVWQRGYQGVSRTNSMIFYTDRAVSEGYINENEAAPLYAEAAVLRSFYWYILTSTFGDVPFYTERVTEENRTKIVKLPRMSATEIRSFCIEELRKELSAMPARRTYDSGTDYRVGRALGLMLGGRLCLWNKDWDGALEFFGQLETIYGDLSQYPLSDVPFSVKYSRESIWEVPNIYEANGLQIVGTLASWTTPLRAQNIVSDEFAQEDIISDIYYGIGIPELGSHAMTYTSVRPTPFLCQNLLPYLSDDLRSGEYSNGAKTARGGSGNLAWRWLGYDPDDAGRTGEKQVMFFGSKNADGTWSRMNQSSTPWLGNKFWCPDMRSTRDANNYKIFRYAGAVLGLAEANLMKGDVASSLHYLNMVRSRAGLSDLSLADVGGNADLLMEEIRRECAKELLGEYNRKFDLVRWGIWYERTRQYNTGSLISQNVRPCNRYWPIPADQVAASGGVLTNKEYGE
ncbi:MAG: RagB/SusD family nutrient uptake outer membrane protein [Bacteroides sp.]|nr:RagB/SusD family nutrient uptake outer membrane protein [Bacteroides sp.]MCI7662884.1 RagB/SusD family nutrient uptake outer membrane protein [Bacteroides sp.]